MNYPFSAYTGSEPYLFVSYAHRDSTLVFDELSWLNDLGFNIWYDQGIGAGLEWREELGKAIREAGVFVYFVTPDSERSEHCRKELNFAMDEGIPVVAVHLKRTELSDGLRLTLSDRQAILKYNLSTSIFRQKLQAGLAVYLEPGKPFGIVTGPNRSLPRMATPVLIGFIALLGLAGYYYLPFQDMALPPSGSEQPATVAAPPTSMPPSLAVLPFLNLNNDPSQEFFSDGLSEDILNGLATVKGLSVRARSSSFRFKGQQKDIREIGQRLQASHILEGTVRTADNRVRVTVQLVDANRDVRLWAGKYDRELVDVFAVQDDISNNVLRMLNQHFSHPAITQSPPTTSIEAYSAYLTGRYHQNREELEPAIAAFEQAIALDPEYADAYGKLAFVYANFMWYSQRNAREIRPIVDRLANTALSLDPLQTEALAVNAGNLFVYDRQYQNSIDEFSSLIERNPNHALLRQIYAQLMLMIGKYDLAVELCHRAVTIDPLSANTHFQLGQMHSFANAPSEAEESFRLAESLGQPAAGQLIFTAMQHNNFDEARRQVDRGPEGWGNSKFYLLIARATLDLATGNEEALARRFPDIKASPEFAGSAMVRYHALRLGGDYDGALDALVQALEEGDPIAMRSFHGIQPVFRALFSDLFQHPRFLALQQSVGLDEQSLSKLNIPPFPVIQTPQRR